MTGLYKAHSCDYPPYERVLVHEQPAPYFWKCEGCGRVWKQCQTRIKTTREATYPKYGLNLWLAKKLGQPVTETFVVTEHLLYWSGWQSYGELQGGIFVEKGDGTVTII